VCVSSIVWLLLKVRDIYLVSPGLPAPNTMTGTKGMLAASTLVISWLSKHLLSAGGQLGED
jgi:hypothetical protein